MASEKNNTKRSGNGPVKALRRAVMLLGAMVIAGSGPILAADGEITFQTNGIGVDGGTTGGQVPNQLNHDVTGPTEALSVDLGAEAVTAIVQVSNLFENEYSGERGQWEAFDDLGQPVGVGIILLPDNQNVGTVTITSAGEGKNTTGAFRYLVFSALPYEPLPPGNVNDSSDYFVRSITYTLDQPGANPIFVGGLNADATVWAPLNPTGFALGAPYLEDGGFIGAEPLVVDTDECSGDGNNNLGCVIPLADDFTLVVSNAPDVSGSFTASKQTIVDTRASCGNSTANNGEATI